MTEDVDRYLSRKRQDTSYHDRNHYNSVVDPYKATIGVGLGLPQLTPGVS